MNDLELHKLKKKNSQMNHIVKSTRKGGYLIADACYSLSYKAKQIASQMEANERNNKKLNKTLRRT